MKIESGVLDVTRMVSNVLMILLLAGNIFFSVNYIEGLKHSNEDNLEEQVQKDTMRLQTARFLKYFIDTVLNSGAEITMEDRVKLENDVLQLHDAEITALWQQFVPSRGKEAQENAVKLMSKLTSKMI